MLALLPLLFALYVDPVLTPARIIEVRPDGRLVDPKAVPVRSTAAPVPIEDFGRRIVLTRGETVWLRATGGRKFKTVVVDRPGVVETKGVDASTVQLRAIETGAIKLTIETVD
jgi:hypothetical protein